MLVLIKGAGDLASGIALRLFRCGYEIVMTEIARPTTVRRTVAFSGAVTQGTAVVEDVTARLAQDPRRAEEIIRDGDIAVLVDPDAACLLQLRPDVVVDAILAKKNLGTKKEDAPVVIGVGPGFTAGVDCDAVVETKRGHTLGRPIYCGSAIENTGVPGNVGGFTIERLIKAPCAGVFMPEVQIGDRVEKGQIVARIDDTPVIAGLTGIVRGMLTEKMAVPEGMKCGDIDPRDCYENCFTVSDKALSVAGGVLEAILALQNKMKTAEKENTYESLQNLDPKVAIRFFNGEKCFGPGVADLLDGIDAAGSLRAASFRMNMSYSKAWTILRECEKNLGYELVTREVGGARGGGAKLTEKGRRLLKQYRDYCRALNRYAKEVKDNY